ncbi:MAG: TRAP-type C4-dicarboxylate transport system, periplasmic component [uncultured Rubellimicrobium sp.]|uniref:TRAP-type C4-dicarboxylate transport system, periplasmic component n=1 Tax=uncultured Rubellimicrobium sp. TaxID=543078 RepID=A0A6J4Q3D5_9RHOB|nr:MAG: TRAP-type C4-dicarboxylate transport system, periplasmic component [uncultured Rubellimicrobium sp.]
MKLTQTALAALLATVAALPAAAQVETRTITISNGVAETHPVANGVTAMQACFDERTGGAWTLSAHWSASLGNDLDATQALRSGTQEMVVTSTSPLVGIEPALGVFDLPFLFANEQEADAILDGEFGQMISGKMEASGLVNLAYWENGFRNLTNSVRPVTKLEDLEGMRVRVMQNDIFLDTFSNLGTNAMPMAFGEVFTALETGTIDAQENPYVTIDTSQFFEVQDYLTETRHAYTPFMVLFSKPIFDTYSAEEQQILRDCALEGQTAQRQASRELSQQSLERVQEAGMAFNQLEPAEIERIREAVTSVYETHADTIGRDVVEAMQAALDELRSGG